MEFATGILRDSPSLLVSPTGVEVGTLSTTHDGLAVADLLESVRIPLMISKEEDALRHSGDSLRAELFPSGSTRHAFPTTKDAFFTLYRPALSTREEGTDDALHATHKKLQRKALLTQRVVEHSSWPSSNGLRDPTLSPLCVSAVISIGSDCTPRQALRIVGLSQRSYPFDWIRSTPRGVLAALRDINRAPFSAVENLHYVRHVPNTNRYYTNSSEGLTGNVFDSGFGLISSHHAGSIEDLSRDGAIVRRVARLRSLIDSQEKKRIVLLFMASSDPLCVDDQLVQGGSTTPLLFETLHEIVAECCRLGQHDVHCIAVNVAPYACCYGPSVTNIVLGARNRMTATFDTVAAELAEILPKFEVV